MISRALKARPLKLLYLFAILTLVGCVSAPKLDHEEINFKTLLKPQDPMIGAALLIIGTASGPRYTFCNGGYLGEGMVITAAHCLLEGFDYYVFVPVAVKTEGPVTDVTLTAIAATQVKPHKEFVQELDVGRVRNDIGMIKIIPPKKSLLSQVRMISDKEQISIPKTLRWDSSEEPYFAGEPNNQLEITGYKLEKDALLKGIYLTRDSISLVGLNPPTKSLLLSINPGTAIHKGVSGSGIFYVDKDVIYLAGIASHVFPGLNLLSAASLREYSRWIKEVARAGNK